MNRSLQVALPGPRSEAWDWQRYAACRGMDVEVFFPPTGERGAARARREEAACRICASCPVRADCAAFARSAGEPYGVWGGLTERERRRRRARPRHPHPTPIPSREEPAA